jgi:hypothetical protein
MITNQRKGYHMNSAIEQYLSVKGVKLIPDGTRLKCLSPLRSEKTPSFSVFPHEDKWRDWGTGEYGNIIDLVMRLENIDSVRGAYKALENLSILQPLATPTNQQATPKERKNKFMDIKVIPLRNFVLKKYLTEERGIKTPFAHSLVKEANYSYISKDGKKKRGWGIVWKDVDGNIHQRNKFFKGLIYTSPKGRGSNFTPLHHKKENTRLIIFEGYFDYLAYVDRMGGLLSKTTYIVLNSTSNVKKFLEYLQKRETKEFKKAFLALDNDEGGDKSTGELINGVVRKNGDKVVDGLSEMGIECVDVREKFKGYEDYNAYHLNHPTTTPKKQTQATQSQTTKPQPQTKQKIIEIKEKDPIKALYRKVYKEHNGHIIKIMQVMREELRKRGLIDDELYNAPHRFGGWLDERVGRG